mgnify:CR=1 FL=1
MLKTVKIAICVKMGKMHKFIHACAGSGKTQYIAETCRDNNSPKELAVITYTVSGQDELRSRLLSTCSSGKRPKVFGWYEFLINQIVRLYLPLLFPEQRISGFYYPKGEDVAGRVMRMCEKTSPERYFTKDLKIHREFLEELSFEIIQASDGKVQNRLNEIFDLILIDEVQDINKFGLEVIDKLLDNGIQRSGFDGYQLLLVGDARQALLSTSRISNKNKKYSGVKVLDWYQGKVNQGLLKIEHRDYTYRCVQEIASFSDQIFDSKMGFPPTQSRYIYNDNHKGVFVVCEKDFREYFSRYSPVVLQYSKASYCKPEFNPLNIGVSKGRTYERTAVFLTGSMEDFIAGKGILEGKSASSFYVAVTRAKLSTALVVNKIPKGINKKLNLEIWSPRIGADVVSQDSLF